MNNLNYMRTHIKYKHKNMPITFQNKVTLKYYTIVEWPLTQVPTLTPSSQPQSQTPQSQTTAPANPANQSPATPTTTSSKLTEHDSNAKTETSSGSADQPPTTLLAPITPTPSTPKQKASSMKENREDSTSIRQKINTNNASAVNATGVASTGNFFRF